MSTIHRDVGHYVCDPDGGVPVLHLDEPSDLVRAIGKLHYLCASENREVYFRGQTGLYDGVLVPSLLRKAKEILAPEEAVARRQYLEGYLSEFWDKDFRRKYVADGPCVEALLQHYGLKTTWLDVVDTVWPALWFSSHESHREEERGVSRLLSRPSAQEFCYVLCLSTGTNPKLGLGWRLDEDCEVVDLRKAVNSVFIRPHCQHGCLMRAVDGRTNYWNLVQDVIRLRTEKVLSWLGTSALTSDSFMFPACDHGLDVLRKHTLPPVASLGGGFL